ncbi:MAG: biopolymer transporter ExbD [Verrucomicrobia bacterium]|nr:biopolymer transporter ExbD [Verrucomicrobiota bacterium]MBU6446345.1 biopolymer transporter ExbD [Verrucomicrobiota bacterium]MDE3047039.1 biopolymer transporter ExbD [Verrucomicrobiota bacterium]
MRRRSRLPIDDSSIEEPFINLTPLIDVVFVVLITFMVIAPVLDIDSVDLAMSAGAEKKEVQNGPISIIVHADNSIWMQGTKVSLTQLETLLKQERKKNPRAIPQLIHDRQAQFGTYQSVKNVLEAIGFEQMDVVLKPG